MKTCLRSLLALAALLPLVSCDKPEGTAVADAGRTDPALGQTQEELAAARDALQRQALEIETRTALMDKQLADMTQALKEQENAGLRRSLDDLQRQNDELRSQAESARRQSDDIGQRLPPAMPAAAIPVTTPPSDYSLFYDQLTPHGRWFDVSGYGYCWRPTITTARWRPYVDGCWSWSSLGWTWQSNEPFGWIVYHYGRWVNLAQYGWVWVPGSEWAPAWVAWRQSQDYVGWAPLPPDPGPCTGVYRDCDAQYNLGPASYVFITTNHFVQPSYTTVCAPVTQNTGIFQSSVNVTQIVRCDDRQRPHVFKHHGGPPRTQVEQACARPVQQVQVQTAAVDQIPAHRPGHHREPSRMQPMIVDFSAGRKETLPARPKITDRIERPKRVDAFDGLPQRVAHEIRETIAEDRASAAVQHEKRPSIRPTAPFPRMTERQGSRPRPDAPRNSTETVRTATAVEDPPAATASTTTATTPPAMPGRDFAAGMRERQAQRDGETRGTPQSRWKRPDEAAQQAPAAVSSAPASTAAVVTNNETAAQPPAAVATVPPAATPVETTSQQPAMGDKTTVDAVVEAGCRPQGGRHRDGEERADGDAEKRRMPPAGRFEEAGKDFAMRHRQQQEEQEAQQRAATAKMAAEQAQAAAETERTRQQAEAAAMQQRQLEEQAAQQRAAAEKMAVEEAKATAEQAERVRQQAEAAQMQRQQEETARRAQEMAQQQAAEQTRREQEMAQRRAEEEARAQAEAEMRRSQEMAQKQAEEQARRAAEEQMQREQEIAQRRAEEEARRAAEEQMRRAQEMAQRQAEEQARRAAEEQMRRAQEMAQRQAEEQARRAAEEQMRRAQEEAQRAAQEAAQRAAEEAARRAAEEAARNQPQPQNPGS